MAIPHRRDTTRTKQAEYDEMKRMKTKKYPQWKLDEHI